MGKREKIGGWKRELATDEAVDRWMEKTKCGNKLERSEHLVTTNARSRNDRKDMRGAFVVSETNGECDEHRLEGMETKKVNM